MHAHPRPTTAALVLATLATISGCATTRSPTSVATGANERHALRVELYFGRDLHGTGIVSAEAFHAFELESIAPRFPDGYTITEARGHWRGPGGVDTDEPSMVLTVLFSPPWTPAGVDERVEPIRREYCDRFRQDAVMRVDTDVDVRFSSSGARERRLQGTSQNTARPEMSPM